MSARAPRSAIDGMARPRKPRGSRSALGASIVVLLLAGTAFFLASGIRIERPDWNSIVAAADAVAAGAGLKPLRFEVRGNRYTSTVDIGQALQLEASSSQLSFDTIAARSRVEALPWVDTAVIRRILPDAVVVDVVERTPAIVWRAADRDVLIDMRGRELAAIARGSDTGLPVVTGEGAGPAAPTLVALLRQHPDLSRRIVEMRRIEGRRWTLQLDSGTLLHLPADGTAAALAWLDGQVAGGLLDMALQTIDLRVAGQLVVRGGRNIPTRISEAGASNATPRGRAAGGMP